MKNKGKKNFIVFSGTVLFLFNYCTFWGYVQGIHFEVKLVEFSDK